MTIRVGVVSSIVMLSVAAGCSKPPSNSVTPAARKPDAFDYLVMMERFATKQLKAPSTARFAPHQEWHAKRISDDRYRLIGWVDAQNTFGAQVRQSFVGTIAYLGNDEFELESIEFLDWYDSNTLAKIADLYEKLQAVEADREAKKLHAAADDSDGIVYLNAARGTQPDYSRARADEGAAALAMRKRAETAQAAEDQAARQRHQREAEIDRVVVAAKAAEDGRYRTWTSAGGGYTFVAKINSFGNGMVTLESRDGVIKKVSVDKLSDADREHVEQWRKSR